MVSKNRKPIEGFAVERLGKVRPLHIGITRGEAENFIKIRRATGERDDMAIVRLVDEDSLNDLWLEYLGGPPHPDAPASGAFICGLCGQSGVLDTRGEVFSPVGVECGVLRFCICPNGRAAAETSLTPKKWLAGRR